MALDPVVGAPGVGTRLEHELTLDAAAIMAGAALVGDMNPLHHDEAFAGRSRFGELIASGAYVSAMLAGIVSKGFGIEEAGGGAVGVEFGVRFLAPVRVGRRVRMEWVVVATEKRRSGTLARLEGRVVDTTDETVALSATIAILYLDGAGQGH